MSAESIETIEDVDVGSEEFIVLHFAAQSSDINVSGDKIRAQQSKLYFFQVADVADLTYKPLRLRDTDGALQGPIGPESGLDYNQLFDENGNDILRNTDSAWRMYHFSIGVRQPDIRIYPRIPDSNEGGGFDWLTGSQPDPEAGDDIGHISSDETDFHTPTAKLESFAYNMDALTQIQYGFYNENPVIRRDPILSIKGKAYDTRPVYDEDDMLEILAQLGKPESERSVSVKVVNFTPTSLDTYSFNVPSEWNNAENNLTVSDVNLPRDIEEALGISGDSDDDSGGDGSGSDDADVPTVEG